MSGLFCVCSVPSLICLSTSFFSYILYKIYAKVVLIPFRFYYVFHPISCWFISPFRISPSHVRPRGHATPRFTFPFLHFKSSRCLGSSLPSPCLSLLSLLLSLSSYMLLSKIFFTYSLHSLPPSPISPSS